MHEATTAELEAALRGELAIDIDLLRPKSAKLPRVEGNPYGDNAIGMAFDRGWWAAKGERGRTAYDQ